MLKGRTSPRAGKGKREGYRDTSGAAPKALIPAWGWWELPRGDLLVISLAVLHEQDLIGTPWKSCCLPGMGPEVGA